jgi:hypothetical protein
MTEEKDGSLERRRKGQTVLVFSGNGQELSIFAFATLLRIEFHLKQARQVKAVS